MKVPERIADHLEHGGLLGYPTETVYGLGAAATAEGVEGVRALKERGSEKPFLILLPGDGPEETEELGWDERSRSLARRHWPGPLTLVLRDVAATYPAGVRSAEGGVAVRVSSHPFVEALMRAWRRPLLSTSANMPGKPPARTAGELSQAIRGRPGADRLWVVDGGALPPSEPSTIVDCTGPAPRVVRAGRIPSEELVEVAE